MHLNNSSEAPKASEISERPKSNTLSNLLSAKACLYRSGLTGRVFGIDLKVEDYEGEAGETVSYNQVDIRTKALMLLGLFEEYFLRSDEESQEFNSLLSLVGEEDLGRLLVQLEGGDLSDDGEPSSVKDSVRGQIKLLLSDPAVRAEFFRVLKREAKLFKRARPTLKKVELFRRLRESIASGVVRLYLRDKQKHGRLLQNTVNAIAHLERKRSDADAEEERLRARASGSTRSWIHVQELLTYKEQLAKTGFVETPSRKRLLQAVQFEVANGNKVFLVGSTGTGKTQLAMMVADLVNKNGFEIVSWQEGTSTGDLYGRREIRTNGHGPESYFNPGPMTVAIEEGKIIIHDEANLGSNRSLMSSNAVTSQIERGAEEIHVPGLHGKMVRVKDSFGEIWTGNPKDERTKDRTDMDPAILRRLVGMKVPYMPADELFKVLLAQFIDDTGLMPLSPQEIEMVRKLSQAAELMQMCHDREIKALESSAAKNVIKRIFGGRLDEVHLDKSFLDTGSLLRLFKGWDLQKARGVDFPAFLKGQLENFIADPKLNTNKEERGLVCSILNFYFGEGLVDLAGVSNDGAESYVLPSKLGVFFGESLEGDVDFEEDFDDSAKRKAEMKKKKKKKHKSKGSSVAPKHSSSNKSRRAPRQMPHHNELKEFLAVQYGAAMETAAIFNINSGDKRLPNKPEVERALLSTVTKEQWKEIQKFKQRRLLIVPYPTSKSRYLAALNDLRCTVPVDARAITVYPYVNSTLAADSSCVDSGGKVNGYRFVITDGCDNLTGHGSWNKATFGYHAPTYSRRIEVFNKHFGPKGMSGLDFPAYILLQMAAMRVGRLIDTETFTLLTQHQKGSTIATGQWLSRRKSVELDDDHLECNNSLARVRASVMGVIEF